jgi:hypothetical protein
MEHAQNALSEPARRQPAAQREAESREAGGPAQSLDFSPRQLTQRQALHSAFGGAVQRAGADEEMLQGRFARPVQRVEEEEPLQGKFGLAQREGAEEEEMLQARFAAPLAQRVEEDEPLQGRFAGTVQRAAAEPATPNRTGMPDALKSGIEALSGMDLSDVRVHTNSAQPAQLNALAYAQGNDIHVAPGQEQHLPHEAWHVVQQRQGRVQPTMQLAGVAVNDSAALESEADVMGARALQRRTPAQLKKVSDDHVGDDLVHPQAERLFSEGTMDWWQNLPLASKVKGAVRDATIKDGRDNIDYQQLRNTTLKNAQGLRSWLGAEAHEHMYVHEGSNIYTGGRDREKLPHPTLVGGDPDATCAGTMWLDNSTRTVTITNESGHFRPSAVASATVELVRSLLPTSKGGKAGYKVKKQEV